MKGIVFNLLEAVVSADHGAGTWDRILDVAGLEGAYTAIGNYPDEHLGRLVAAASQTLGVPAGDVVRQFGRAALPMLAARYPGFFATHRETRSFLLSLNDIIHPEVRKLYPGADTPDFAFDTSVPGTLIMDYASARRLCAFAEGLIQGAAAHFHESVEIAHVRCMHHGADFCRLELTFARADACA
jgi:hypothetical protein